MTRDRLISATARKDLKTFHDIREARAEIERLSQEVERLKAEILDARRVGRPPEDFWLEEP